MWQWDNPGSRSCNYAFIIKATLRKLLTNVILVNFLRRFLQQFILRLSNFIILDIDPLLFLDIRFNIYTEYKLL